MCILIFSKTISDMFLILRRIQQDMIMNLHKASCNKAVFLLSSKA
jgi:hypothetical protein